MFSRPSRIVWTLVAVVGPMTSTAAAAGVSYDGFVYSDGFVPIVNGFAIAGTFAPAFDPYNYGCTYGDDESCNMFTTHYSQAVAEGNFIPIGAGTHTNGSGGFSGAGTTSVTAGTPIFLFLFDHPDPDMAGNFALATSSDASYKVPAGDGSTTIHGSEANSFVFGFQGGNGILVNVLPFPEPSACLLAVIGTLLPFGVRGPRRRCS